MYSYEHGDYEIGNTLPNPNDYYLLYHSKGQSYVHIDKVTSNMELANKYKVMSSKVISGHAGETDANGQIKVFSKVGVLKPQEVCTETYIPIGCFETLKESVALEKYLYTKFVRFLVNLTLSSINIVRGNYQFVPLQDFASSSDIDWSKPIADIDRQLYAKYNITSDEIAFIEKMIKPME